MDEEDIVGAYYHLHELEVNISRGSLSLASFIFVLLFAFCIQGSSRLKSLAPAFCYVRIDLLQPLDRL